jgi:hypothetical protein
MDLKMWYWIILVVWILFAGVDAFADDIRFRRGGNIVLIVLLVLIGFMVTSGPVK